MTKNNNQLKLSWKPGRIIESLFGTYIVLTTIMSLISKYIWRLDYEAEFAILVVIFIISVSRAIYVTATTPKDWQPPSSWYIAVTVPWGILVLRHLANILAYGYHPLDILCVMAFSFTVGTHLQAYFADRRSKENNV